MRASSIAARRRATSSALRRVARPAEADCPPRRHFIDSASYRERPKRWIRAFKGGRACAVMSATICSAVISAPSCAESLDTLYQQAKAEGALVFYSGGPVEPYERFAKDFKEKYPGIQVS